MHYTMKNFLIDLKKKEKVNILEIGSLLGASAASFLNYFKLAKICCLDINPFQMKYLSNQIRPLFIDTKENEIIKDVANYINYDFDIIIDDGSHNKKDQILCLNAFLPKLKRNGIYVIEDTYQYLEIPALNEDNLDYGINEFLISIKNTGDHITSYLDSSEKNKYKQVLKIFILKRVTMFIKILTYKR